LAVIDRKLYQVKQRKIAAATQIHPSFSNPAVMDGPVYVLRCPQNFEEFTAYVTITSCVRHEFYP
jgi:hypothetical protein